MIKWFKRKSNAVSEPPERITREEVPVPDFIPEEVPDAEAAVMGGAGGEDNIDDAWEQLETGPHQPVAAAETVAAPPGCGRDGKRKIFQETPRTPGEDPGTAQQPCRSPGIREENDRRGASG